MENNFKKEFKITERAIELYLDDKGAGSLVYTLENSVFTIESIFVNPLYRGMGLASELVHEAIKFCETNDYKIHPVCSYAVDYFKKHPHQLVQE
ncbi:GNAT family N-acetyltransferase [Culicoidibacter larvae]|uniref:N-acetyltransferase n=1 Tax=Culicoidibacter larvae TaxID=2579976 RepID=A0A5R8QDI3_9FIRM|nr:GNAT family N-acetyltransferase [Culicoidibacter larvae]TLG74326.1 N-acetyltransferase [Culicoidibacter larvae]